MPISSQMLAELWHSHVFLFFNLLSYVTCSCFPTLKPCRIPFQTVKLPLKHQEIGGVLCYCLVHCWFAVDIFFEDSRCVGWKVERSKLNNWLALFKLLKNHLVGSPTSHWNESAIMECWNILCEIPETFFCTFLFPISWQPSFLNLRAAFFCSARYMHIALLSLSLCS